MTKISLFEISQSDRKKFCEAIIEGSAPSADFYLLVVLSALIVSLGLVKDNVVLLIGGMLVAPILSSILAISLGLIILNFKVIFRSIRIMATSLILSVFISFWVGLSVYYDISSIKLMQNIAPSWYVFIVALIAGTAASFTWAKPNLNSTLPGIAITVTLIPPMAAIGLALASMDYNMVLRATQSLFLNIGGIILASLIVFFFMKFYRVKRKIISEVNHEERDYA
jgi:uncharacterized hydrophobic protein (TIGR00271 family)